MSASKTKLDCSVLGHVFGFMTSLADARLRKSFFLHTRELKLRPVEFCILALLTSNQQVTQKRLCMALDTPAPNLAVIMVRLQERGLTQRARSEHDRRELHVELTPAGRELALKAIEASRNMEREALAALSEDEQGQLYALLYKVARGGRAPLKTTR